MQRHQASDKIKHFVVARGVHTQWRAEGSPWSALRLKTTS
jgi:hypothetical protein